MGYVFMIFGFAFMTFAFSRLKIAKESLSWEKVKGTVTSNFYMRDKGDAQREQTLSRQAVTYAFEYNMHKVETDKLSYKWTKRSCQDLLKSYPAGSEITVYVNPKNYKNSVIDPGPDRTNYFSIAAGFYITACGVAILFFENFRQFH